MYTCPSQQLGFDIKPFSTQKQNVHCIACVFQDNPLQGTSVRVAHVFSCELNPEKRKLIRKQHPSLQHLFADVCVFADGHGFCEICQCDHAVTRHTLAIDLLYTGTSCKDVSKLNGNRTAYLGCYAAKDSGGTSGPTYENGFRKVPRLHSNCLLFAHTFTRIIYIYTYILGKQIYIYIEIFFF